MRKTAETLERTKTNWHRTESTEYAGLIKGESGDDSTAPRDGDADNHNRFRLLYWYPWETAYKTLQHDTTQ